MCNRWVLPSKGGNSYINDRDEENDEENVETTAPETSSENRWRLPGCVLASSFYTLGRKEKNP
jgi:hypothetical protein